MEQSAGGSPFIPAKAGGRSNHHPGTFRPFATIFVSNAG